MSDLSAGRQDAEGVTAAGKGADGHALQGEERLNLEEITQSKGDKR